jgi:transcriptional regulator GlxA family with amidase domain
VDYIHAHFADKLTVTQLCSVAGVSERTLLYAFVYMFGISPQQYLMHHRLEQARETLKRGSTAGIADVADACGIHHAGRFARYFMDKYGEFPSVLLADAPVS